MGKNLPIGAQGHVVGLPYELGQLLLQKSKEDREAYAKASKIERIRGASSLAPSPPEGEQAMLEDKGEQAQLEDKGEGTAAAPASTASGGRGNKKSAKVAPA